MLDEQAKSTEGIKILGYFKTRPKQLEVQVNTEKITKSSFNLNVRIPVH